MARIHYDILQIQPEASAEEIQHAYRKLALRYHPDRNSAPDAASQMAAINEAYEIVRDSTHTSPLTTSPSKPAVCDELTLSILDAARAVILRHGWTVSHEDGIIVVFETGNPRVRAALTDRLSSDSVTRITRQFRDLAAILAVHINRPIGVGLRISVIDLMHAERHGPAIPDGPCKSLLSSFL